QFIPSTWAGHQQDGGGDTYREDQNGIPDGKKNVQSIWDAAFGASHLLAANGAGDFTADLDKLRDAASRYNSGCQWEPDPNASDWCKRGGQAFEETRKYISRIIPAFQRFYVATTLAASNFPVDLTANPTFSNDWLAPREDHLHAGIDIYAPRGTALIAVTDGTIEGLEEGDGWGGLKFWLNPGGEQKYYYAHIINPRVRNGQKVRAGEILAGVGTANKANHLHFGIAVPRQQESAYRYAKLWWINPYQFLVNLKGNGQ
ncbi:M23 family metallopeptidase, partial [Candidatus Berkelbacteria bacterium]|nr:M23 family metallopeptidase [Candidatus Berkelbacteria bacterium]